MGGNWGGAGSGHGGSIGNGMVEGKLGAVVVVVSGAVAVGRKPRGAGGGVYSYTKVSLIIMSP